MAAVFPAASRSVISSSKDWGLAGGPSGKAPLRGHGCFGWSLAFLHHLVLTLVGLFSVLVHLDLLHSSLL